MKLEQFQKQVCRTGLHCRTCRHRDGGVNFRTAQVKDYDLGMIDFPCPQDLPWGYKPPATQISTSPQATGWHTPIFSRCCDPVSQKQSS